MLITIVIVIAIIYAIHRKGISYIKWKPILPAFLYIRTLFFCPRLNISYFTAYFRLKSWEYS